MKILEIIPNIAKHPLFSGVDLTHADRYWNDDSMRICRFAEGDRAYSSESERLCVGILLSGTAQIQTGMTGEATLLRTVKVGEMFGIANLYAEEEPFPTQIVAKGDCEILFIDGEAFREFVENDRVALRNFLAFQSATEG